jgi:Ni2+-binding GTPase involved in maturation of urease and hydrogenase
MSAEGKAWRPTVVVVGGFLGAGKTTLILQAAQLLEKRGVRAAVVLNDQGKELVDTELAGRYGLAAGEVTGGCFCCRFSDLLAAMDGLREWRPEVIFAEPVGSCTDIAATVLAPLREEFDRYRVAPLSVLVDPARAELLGNEDADANMAFLYEKQLEEADLVCMTKADLYPDAKRPEAQEIAGKPVRYLSAKTGQGVSAWLDEVLAGGREESAVFLDIDYEQYARAEAALAWLNLSLRFVPEQAALPSAVAGPFLDGLDAALTQAGIRIVHLKLMNTTATGWVKAAQCANGAEPEVEGMLDASPAAEHEMLLNLRAVGEPGSVEAIVRGEVKRMAGRMEEMRLDCFSPAPPVPERRVVRERLA